MIVLRPITAADKASIVPMLAAVGVKARVRNWAYGLTVTFLSGDNFAAVAALNEAGYRHSNGLPFSKFIAQDGQANIRGVAQ